jgi:hypothetical protein
LLFGGSSKERILAGISTPPQRAPDSFSPNENLQGVGAVEEQNESFGLLWKRNPFCHFRHILVIEAQSHPP